MIHFARLLNEVGVAWEDMHHEVSVSRWLFEPPHPAATGREGKRWTADLVLLRNEDFLAASLPATDPTFKFDACLEFAYLDDFWTFPGVNPYGEPKKRRDKVEADVDKVIRYLATGVCRFGYVIVVEECDWGFPRSFVADAAKYGCRVRFIQNYSTA